MSHSLQRAFCDRVRKKFPLRFKNADVLDIGSLDINGNNRYLFRDCSYIGIDLAPGENVDIVCPAHEFMEGPFDVVIATEVFEHDKNYVKTLKHVAEHLLHLGGLFLFTCAAPGRRVHGTYDSNLAGSPATGDYFVPLSEENIRQVLDLDSVFRRFEFELEEGHADLYFWGIKKDKKV